MIFRTITDDITGANKSIGLFGKSLNDIKGIINSFKQNGFVNTLLNTPLINIDIDAIDNYNNAIRAGKTYEDALATARRTTNAETVALIESSHGAEVQIERVTAAQKASTIAAKAHSAALKAASIAGNMILFAAISKGIQLATTAIDNWIHRVEKANEAMNEAVGEYDSAKSSLESINSELEEQNKQIDELLAKDKLTYAEKGQLEELQAITRELLLQQDIEQRRADKASKDVAEKTVDAYEKQYGKYDVSREKLNETLDYINSTGISAIADSENDIVGNIAAYLNVTEGLKKAQQEYETALNNGEDTEFLIEDVQDYIDAIDDYSDVLDQNISDLQEKRLALEDEYNKAVAKRENGQDLTSYETDAISTYESIYDAIKLIYEYTNKNDWNNMEISNIFNTEGIEKTKEELISLAEAGKLKPEYITQNFKTLNKAVQDSEIILEDGQTAVEAFCEEIYRSSETALQFRDALSSAKSKFGDTIELETEALNEARENLENEYEKLSDWGLEDYAEKMKNDTISSIFGNVDMDKRTIITWSDELKQTYADALASWEYDPEIGGIDTVFGGSSRFGESINGTGWEVAFTPILPDGTFLSSDTVYEYIESIVTEAYNQNGEVTENALKSIDAQGRQIGDTFVHGIFAAVDDSLDYDNNGNLAETIGRLMHFTGDFGAVKLAKQEIEDARKVLDWDSWFNENVKTPEEIEIFQEIIQDADSAADAIEKYRDIRKGIPNENPISTFEDAWADSFTSENDKVKELGDTLLDLAENGRLTKEAFKEADSTAGDYFKNLGISADEAVSKINKLVDESSQLSSMSDQISSMAEALGTKLENGFVEADTLSGFDVEVRGLESWDRFQEVLGSTASSYEECQNAANALATEWINSSDFLAQLTQQNEEYYKTQLKAMGIENYDEVIEYAHALNTAKEVLMQSSLELGDATYDEIEALIAEGTYSELTANMILALYDAKIAEQAVTLDTAADCQNLINLAGDTDRTSQSIQLLIQLMNIYNQLESGAYENNAVVRGGALAAAVAIKSQLETLANGEVKNMEIEPTVKLGSKGKSSASKSGKKAADAYLEAFEKELEKLQGMRDRNEITEKEYLDRLRVA